MGLAAFRAFLQAVLNNQMFYGPVLAWAWVRGCAFKEVKEEGFDGYLVPDFEAVGEYEKVGEDGQL